MSDEITIASVAALAGCTVKHAQNIARRPGFPRVIGKRGQWHTYNHGEVIAWLHMRRDFRTPVVLDGLLNTREAADVLGVRYETVCRLARMGRLLPVKVINRRAFFEPADVKEYGERKKPLAFRHEGLFELCNTRPAVIGTNRSAP